LKRCSGVAAPGRLGLRHGDDVQKPVFDELVDLFAGAASVEVSTGRALPGRQSAHPFTR